MRTERAHRVGDRLLAEDVDAVRERDVDHRLVAVGRHDDGAEVGRVLREGLGDVGVAVVVRQPERVRRRASAPAGRRRRSPRPRSSRRRRWPPGTRVHQRRPNEPTPTWITRLVMQLYSGCGTAGPCVCSQRWPTRFLPVSVVSKNSARIALRRVRKIVMVAGADRHALALPQIGCGGRRRSLRPSPRGRSSTRRSRDSGNRPTCAFRSRPDRRGPAAFPRCEP